MRPSKRILVYTAVALGPVVPVYARPAAPNFSAAIESYTDASKDLYNSLETVLDEGSDSVDSTGRRRISEYYSGLKKTYIADVFKERSQGFNEALAAYVRQLNNVQAKVLNGMSVDSSKKDAYDKARAEFNSCLRSKGMTDFARADTDGFTSSLARKLDSDYPSSSRARYQPEISDRDEEYRSIAKLLRTDWEKEIGNCCSEKFESLTKKGSYDSVCVDFDTAFQDPEYVKALSKVQTESDRLTLPIAPPDPLENGRLKAEELAVLLQNDEVRDRLKSARSHRDRKSDDPASSEIDELNDIANDCKNAQRKRQQKAHPLANGTLANSLVKTLKCSVIPFLSSQYLDTPYHQAVVGLSGTPIGDKSQNWDLNCDPAETAMWANIRPTDPGQIFQQWGIPQMQNPPYIQSLRTLPPIQAPFPMVPLPTGGLLTPYGTLGTGLAPGVGGVNVQATGALASSGRRTTATSAGRRVAASRSGYSRTSTGPRLASSRRGIVQGQGLARGVRQLSSNISQGRNLGTSTATLRSGAAKTRSLAQTMVQNNQKRGLANVRKDRAASSRTALRYVRGLASARASRTTGSNILKAIRGRTATTTTTPPTGNVGSFGNIQQQNQAARARVDFLVQTYYTNINSARQKADQVRLQIAQRIADRDMAITKAMEDIVDKPPGKQSKIMSNLRNELLKIDKELAGMKAQYDVFQGSVLDQASAIRTLTVFGTQGMAANGMQNLQGLPTSTVPGFPTVTPPTTGGTRNSWMKVFLPIQVAYAAQQKAGAFGSEQEWRKAWDKFLGDYESYVNSKEREEKDLTKKALAAWRDRSNSITEKTAQDTDTETLVAMEMFAGALSDETKELLDQAQRNRLEIGNDVAGELRKVREDATLTQESLDALSLQYKDTYPKSADDNLEVWWGLLPEMIIY